MLVLRRRPNEAIVFDGGLMLTLVSVDGHDAWLDFSGGGLERPIALALPANASGHAALSLRNPRHVTLTGSTTVVELTGAEEDLGAVLTLSRHPGDSLQVGPLCFLLTSIEEDRVYLELRTESLPAPVTLSIFTVSTVDARIGVNAPAELRVYRKEVWDEMQAANTAAAGEWTPEDLAALSSEPPPPLAQ